MTGQSIRRRLQAEGQAIFDDDLMRRAAGYVARGRAHAALTTAEIKDRWTAAFKSLAIGTEGAPSGQMEDFWVELSLRGEHPPFDRVQNELELLKQAMAALEMDPEFHDSTHAAIDEYRRRRTAPTN